MKITLLNGAFPHYNFGLNKITAIVCETLAELSVETNEICVPFLQIPLYDGFECETANDLANEIVASDGVIFAAVASNCSSGAAFSTLFEHLENGQFSNCLQGKNCMIIVISNDNLSYNMNYYSNVVQNFGGFDCVRVPILQRYTSGEISANHKEIVEKQTEDFYRIAKQNRKFLSTIATKTTHTKDSYTNNEIQKQLQAEQFDLSTNAENKPKTTVSEIYEKLNLDKFNEKQEEDINEIAQFFAENYSTNDNNQVVKRTPKILAEDLSRGQKKVAPRGKTCAQLTASLTHYFQPQMAAGLNETIQLVISGDETFSGYFSINNAECTYVEGTAELPDITILSDCAVWTNVVKGKITAQKAFMIGSLKVRGNFVMLTKFEQLFSVK